MENFIGLESRDILTILAIILAPFLAVFVQRKIDLWRGKRERKLDIFKTLMATRDTVLSPNHVRALNMIDLEFQEASERKVRSAWNEYHDHLNSYPSGNDIPKETFTIWHKDSERHLMTLLAKMGESLSYKFDPVKIRKGGYTPKGHVNTENDYFLIRKYILECLRGDRNIPIAIVPKDSEAQKEGQHLIAKLLSPLGDQGAIKVELLPQRETSPSDK